MLGVIVRRVGNLKFRGSLGQQDEPHTLYKSLLQACQGRDRLTPADRAFLREQVVHAPTAIARVTDFALLQDLFHRLSTLSLCTPECQEAVLERATWMYDNNYNRLQTLLFKVRYFEGMFPKQHLIESELLHLIRASEVPLTLSSCKQVLSSLYLVKQICDFQTPRTLAAIDELIQKNDQHFLTLESRELVETLLCLKACRSAHSNRFHKLTLERLKIQLERGFDLAEICDSAEGPIFANTWQELTALYAHSSPAERSSLKEIILRRGEGEGMSLTACLRLLSCLDHLQELDLLERIFQELSVAVSEHQFITSYFLTRLMKQDVRIAEVFGRSLLVEFGPSLLALAGTQRGLWKQQAELLSFGEALKRVGKDN